MSGETPDLLLPDPCYLFPLHPPARPCHPANVGAIHSDRPSCQGVAHPSRCDHSATYRCHNVVAQAVTPGIRHGQATRTESRSSTWAYCGVEHRCSGEAVLRRTSCRASPNLRPVSAETSVPCCLFHHWRIMDSPLRHGSFHRALPTGGVTTTVFIPYSLIPIPFLTPARPCRPATGAIHSDRPSCRGVAHPSRCDHPATYRCQWRTRGSPLRLGSFHRALPAGGVITSVDQRSSPGGHAWNSSRSGNPDRIQVFDLGILRR